MCKGDQVIFAPLKPFFQSSAVAKQLPPHRQQWGNASLLHRNGAAVKADQIRFDNDAPRTLDQYAKEIAARLKRAAALHLVARKHWHSGDDL